MTPEEKKEDTRAQGKERKKKILCPACGQRLDPDEMAWSAENDQPCCHQCMLEEESCGCADE